nr:MAG TPA: hypothetical protein [Caudoviricetes sp.]
MPLGVILTNYIWWLFCCSKRIRFAIKKGMMILDGT